MDFQDPEVAIVLVEITKSVFSMSSLEKPESKTQTYQDNVTDNSINFATRLTVPHAFNPKLVSIPSTPHFGLLQFRTKDKLIHFKLIRIQKLEKDAPSSSAARPCRQVHIK